MNVPNPKDTLDIVEWFPPTALTSATTSVFPSSSTGLATPVGSLGKGVLVFTVKGAGATLTAAAVTIKESDTTNGTYAAVTGAGTNAAVTSSATGVEFIEIPMEVRKGFLRCEVASPTSCTASVSGSLIYGGLPTQP